MEFSVIKPYFLLPFRILIQFNILNTSREYFIIQMDVLYFSCVLFLDAKLLYNHRLCPLLTHRPTSERYLEASTKTARWYLNTLKALLNYEKTFLSIFVVGSHVFIVWGLMCLWFNVSLLCLSRVWRVLV